MKITIVGAGIGGLSAGIALSQQQHSVTVLEDKDGVSEFGAGIQLSPNAIRVLQHWGIASAVEQVAFAPAATFAKRFDSGCVLGKVEQNPPYEDLYGFPYWQVHRPDLQRALFDRAQELGVTIQTAARVVNLDAETGTVILADGSILSSELTICADGLSSRTRTALLDNQPSSPRPLPDSVYRAMIPRTTMMARLDTAQLMSSNNSQLFMGPHRALLGYPIARGELYNIAITILNTTTEIDTARVGKWDEPVASSELKTMFHDFCPQVQVLLDLVEHCTKWTIAEVPSLKSWSSASGRAVLLGDAAHAMSPHLAQGGGMAIEDATVLAECLQLVKSVKDDMPAALKCYEAIRKPRVARIAELARDNGASMLLVDGAAQEARDRRLAASMCAGSYAETSAIFREVTPDATAAWPSPPLLKWLYGFDAAGDAKCQLKQLWSSVTNGLVKTVEPTTTPSAAMRTRAA